MEDVLWGAAAGVVRRRLKDNHHLAGQHSGLRLVWPSSCNILMLVTRGCQNGLEPVAVALGNAGALDRVWHGGLAEKHLAKGAQGQGGLLQFLGQ